MKYYIRLYGSNRWRRVGRLAALITFKKIRNWGSSYASWNTDMLSVPNLIDCADAELMVIGRDGAPPLKGLKNLRHDEYYEIVSQKVTSWVRQMQKEVYKTEYLSVKDF